MSTTEIQLQSDFQRDLIAISKPYLEVRGSNSPEFAVQFNKTLSDMVYSQTDEGLEALKKARPQSLLNAVFRACEVGASFAKKEISVLPFAIYATEKKDGVTSKRATGQNDLTIVVDINFQKQQILAMPNCKHFFVAEVHDGVEILHDLSTGNCIFDGKNDVTKPTIGYYAKFLSTDNEVYDLFMTCGEIIDRAKTNPGFKEANYKNTAKSIHFEKIVVRNLMKIIPKVSNELRSVLAWDDSHELTEYVDVSEPKVNALEEAKKAIHEPVQPQIQQPIEVEVKEEQNQVIPTNPNAFF